MSIHHLHELPLKWAVSLFGLKRIKEHAEKVEKSKQIFDDGWWKVGVESVSERGFNMQQWRVHIGSEMIRILRRRRVHCLRIMPAKRPLIFGRAGAALLQHGIHHKWCRMVSASCHCWIFQEGLTIETADSGRITRIYSVTRSQLQTMAATITIGLQYRFYGLIRFSRYFYFFLLGFIIEPEQRILNQYRLSPFLCGWW